MNLIDVCRQFIAVDSSPHSGNREAAYFIGQLAQEMGFVVDYDEAHLDGIEQANVMIRLPQAPEEEQLLLETHLDTSDPGIYSQWTRTLANPFNASIYDEGQGQCIYGLGSADAKLDMICKLFAAQKFLKHSLKKAFVIVGTYGEESGMSGAIRLVRQRKVKAKKAFIGEPTQLQLAYAGPGVVAVEVNIPFTAEEIEYKTNHDLMESSSTQSKIFKGKSAHSSFPQLGDNAIIKMLEYLTLLPEGIAVMDMEGGVSDQKVPDSAFLEIDMVGSFKETVVDKIKYILKSLKAIEKSFKDFSHKEFEPTISTLNIGKIKTYGDYLRISGSCRLVPTVPQDVTSSWIKTLKSSCTEVGATFRVTDFKSAFQTKMDGDFMKSALKIQLQQGLRAQLTTATKSTEANIFNKMGIECIVFGPGQGAGNSHAPNEFVSVTDLEQAIEFYKSIIECECL